MKKEIPYGLKYILLGLLFLIITLIINRTIDISDIFIIILMIISIIIELYGLILIIKNKNY